MDPTKKLPDPDRRKRRPGAKPPAVPLPLAPRVEDVPEVEVAPVQLPEQVTAYQAEEVRRLLAERAKRKLESLRLYEPLPVQLGFHASNAPERLLRGSNRGGKTLPAAVEVARALCGQDPFGKYPTRDGRCFAIGKDGKHIAEVMYRKLFRSAPSPPFKIIRDRETNDWRAFRPWDAADAARTREAKPAPPLVPSRYVKHIAWENKKEGQPSLIVLHTGWEIRFFSSLGKPPQGSDLDLVWMDEEIVDPEWYPEMSARLLDRCGRFIWSAAPQAGTEQLWDLHERAEAQQGQAHPKVAEFIIRLADNRHISEEQKQEFASKLSEQDRLVRVEGEFALLSFKVFPEFELSRHNVQWFQIPRDWTRFVSVDPGRQVCAVLFGAVPPPDVGDYVYLYEELYIPNCDAEQFGQKMAHKSAGQVFQAFIIDRHGGRVREAGSGRSVEEQYSAALRKYKVQSLATGSNFVAGSDDPVAGVEEFRGWLRTRDANTPPKLRLFADKLPNFLWEITRYRYKRVNGLVTDKPEDRGRVHQMANARYLASYQPRYVKPPAGKAPPRGAMSAFRAKKERQKERQGDSPVTLGPRQHAGV